MFITTINQFVKYIPTAGGTEYTAIEPYLLDAENQLKSLFVGDDLFAYIAGLTTPSTLKDDFTRLIAMQAYQLAIPFVDLIQTPNGFAVVSNSNLAPASKERVERLLQWVESQLMMYTDLLITSFLKTSLALAQWMKSPLFLQYTNCLFVLGHDFANYHPVQGSKRKAFLEAKPKLLAWQTNILEKVISASFMTALISEIRTNTFTTGSENVIHYCKMILSRLMDDDKEGATALCNTLSNILAANLTTYTEYAASPEYALKTSAPYQNKEEDTTFFFAM
jgi:hypothetical protein